MRRWVPYLCHRVDGKLFRRYTKSANEEVLTECQFADDVTLLATTRAGAEKLIMTYRDVADDLGLTVSIPKTKLSASGYGVDNDDKKPITTGREDIEYIEEFPYLGSVLMSYGRLHTKVDRRIANASRAFGALHRPVFDDAKSNLIDKESWIFLRKHLKRLDGFHHKCLRTILRITN